MAKVYRTRGLKEVPCTSEKIGGRGWWLGFVVFRKLEFAMILAVCSSPTDHGIWGADE